MTSKDVKAVEWTCDGCGRTVLMQEHEGIPDGFHGTVTETGSWGGGPSATWWACKATHIAKAVTSALDREEARS